MKSISEYLEEDYEKWGNDPYISEFDGEKYCSRSFKETISEVRNFARGLLEEGLQGKNIMIYSENSYKWMVIDLSIMGYVGTCVPIDKEWTAFDINHVLASIETAAIFYSKAKKECVEQLKQCNPNIKYYCIEEEFERIKEIGQKQKEDQELIGQADMDEAIMIMFTSGTTSFAKAIPLTQNNLFYIYETINQRTPMSHTDISYVFLPLNHVFAGVNNLLYSLISGMQLYLCYDIRNMIPEMMRVRPTILCLVPLILQRIYVANNEAVLEMLRKVRFIYCGGSFLNPEMKSYFLSHGIHLLEAYGSTETSSVIALDKLDNMKTGASGVALECLEVKILNPDENGVGEVIVKGGSVSKGYLNCTSGSSEFDSQGYYHTGDLAYMDADRHLYLKGRKKRMIITGNGKNVYVDELEQLILENKEIKKVTVFEENYHITASIFSNLSENEVQNYIDRINEKLPDYKKIKKVYAKEDVLGGRFK